MKINCKVKSVNTQFRLCSWIIAVAALVIHTGCALLPDGGRNSPSTNVSASTKQERSRAIATGTDRSELDLQICKMKVSNPPDAVNRKISRTSQTSCVNGVPLLVAPAPGACLTSGFGKRNGRQHKGVDYQSKPAGNVVAAASGVVYKREFREKDFGNWVIVDHGSNVYTAYAHLASIDRNVREGASVVQGQTLGVMGKTGPNWIKAVHLHYEVRAGDMKKARSFFNLKAIDPFSLPESCPTS